MDLYFERHDGEAATVEDFVQALADGSGLDLTQFKRWYAQSGTPEVQAEGVYDKAARSYTLTLTQTCPPTPGQAEKNPFHIPVALGLVGPGGADLPLRLDGEAGPKGTTRVLDLKERSQKFRFVDVPAPPVPSLMRGFSAPVKLSVPLAESDWILLMTHDSDPFNQWEAVQKYATERLVAAIGAARRNTTAPDHDALVAVFRRLLGMADGDPAFIALALDLPSEQTIAQTIARDVDVDAILAARERLRTRIGEALRDLLVERYHRSKPQGPYRPDAAQMGLRSLRNACLSYLVAASGRDGIALALRQFETADNMTDSIAALGLIADSDAPERQDTLDAFYRRWKDDPLVLDKWFATQAMSARPDTLARIVTLTGHPAFTMRNPNRVRALIGSFANFNQVRFHGADGAGHRFVADKVLELDKLNPQVAARLLGAFNTWRQFDAGRRASMAQELKRIAASDGLSRNVAEIVTKTLA
jgi:aminopeptidase N